MQETSWKSREKSVREGITLDVMWLHIDLYEYADGEKTLKVVVACDTQLESCMS